MAASTITRVLAGAAIAWSGIVGEAAAQVPERSQAPEAVAEQPTVPVVVDGVTLFYVRGTPAYPAERRARAIANRIVDVAADRTIPVESLTVRETPLASALVAAGQPVVQVVDADAQLEGATRQLLAEIYRVRIADAITRFRHDREAAVLWRSAGKALAATLALVLALWLGRGVFRKLRALLERWYQSRTRSVHIYSFEVVQGKQLRRGLHRAVGIVATILTVTICYIYLNYVLILFPWTRALGRQLLTIFVDPLVTLSTGLLGYIPQFVFLVILLLLAHYALKLSKLFFQRVADGTLALPGFEREWALPTGRIIRLLIVAFTLVIAYPNVPGSGSEAFKGITILLGLIFSLGSPSVIGNLVAGQSLAFRRVFRVGDRVKIGEHVGDVAQVRLLATYLRSPKNEQIVVPNSLVLNTEVVNFSTLANDTGVILHTMIGIGYEVPWRQVEAMLLEAASRTPGLLLQPAPFVLAKALATFAVDYEINVYCNTPRVMGMIYNLLHRNILDVFNEYGVQIMTPAYEGDPDRPKVVPREAWFTAPANTQTNRLAAPGTIAPESQA